MPAGLTLSGGAFGMHANGSEGRALDTFFLSNVAHYSGGGKEMPASLYSQRRNFLHACQRTRRARAKDNSTFCVTTVDFSRTV